jgi:UDP-glucose 4-epimerase
MEFDAIFHIAGQSSGEASFDDPVSDIRSNAESTLLLLRLCLEVGCTRFIFASTMSVYGHQESIAVGEKACCRPESFYGVAKLASENYLRIYEQYGIRATSLRLFNVYGVGQNLNNLKQGMVSIFLAQMMNSGKIQVKGSADRFRDFIHVDDVVEAFIRCLNNASSEGETINVATGIQTRVSELIHLMTDSYSGDVPVEYCGTTPGDVHGLYADIRKMEKVLGSWARVDLETGIRLMLSRYSERHDSGEIRRC